MKTRVLNWPGLTSCLSWFVFSRGVRRRIFVILAPLLAAQLARAITYNIAPDTFVSTLNLAAGDQVVFADGDYSDKNLLTVTAKGTASAPVNVMAATPGKAIFRGTTALKITG